MNLIETLYFQTEATVLQHAPQGVAACHQLRLVDEAIADHHRTTVHGMRLPIITGNADFSYLLFYSEVLILMHFYY